MLQGEIKTWLETKYGEPIVFQGICTIGRAESNNIIISKGPVSRHHAIIHERDSEYWLVDLGGLNGTLLNGKRVIQSARLKSGDVIRIPLMEFVFRQEEVSAQSPAPVESNVPFLGKPSPEVTRPPALPSSPAEASLPLAITIPMPTPVKPTQQDELFLGLPPEPLAPPDKPKRARVYVGPVDTQGLPKALPVTPAGPEERKLPEAIAAGVSRTTSLPKQSDDLLTITKPLSFPPPVEKPREVTSVKAPDIVVPEPEKPKAPAVAKTDSPSQPSGAQEAPSSIRPVPALPIAPAPVEPKPVVKKVAVPIPKEDRATPEVIPPAGLAAVDASTPPAVICPTAMHSVYIGLASIFLPFVGLLIAPIAIILGHSALNKINQSRGTLVGRQSAVMGLYFGYISLALISGYSVLFYFLFLSPRESKGSSLSTTPLPILVYTPPSTAPATPAPKTSSSPVPTSAPAPLTDTSAAPPRLTPDLQVSIPSPAVPEAPSPAPDVTRNSPPEATPVPATAAAFPTTAPTPIPQMVVNESPSANAATPPPQDNSSSTTDTGAAPAVASAEAAPSVPPAAAPAPAVYDRVVLNRLKDGMLAQPMPDDPSSRAYMDADDFNNCARLLARPPEEKYAESVDDFLEDVKKRNPDRVRLQILTTMYENYMAGLKKDF